MTTCAADLAICTHPRNIFIFNYFTYRVDTNCDEIHFLSAEGTCRKVKEISKTYLLLIQTTVINA